MAQWTGFFLDETQQEGQRYMKINRAKSKGNSIGMFSKQNVIKTVARHDANVMTTKR